MMKIKRSYDHDEAALVCPDWSAESRSVCPGSGGGCCCCFCLFFLHYFTRFCVFLPPTSACNDRRRQQGATKQTNEFFFPSRFTFPACCVFARARAQSRRPGCERALIPLKSQRGEGKGDGVGGRRGGDAAPTASALSRERNWIFLLGGSRDPRGWEGGGAR